MSDKNSKDEQVGKHELDDSNHPLDQQIDQALDKLGLSDIDWKHYDITPELILYLINHCPYLQIVSTGGGSDTLSEPEFITAKSGWVIHYYGDAMSSSPGELLFSGGYFPIEDEDDGGGSSGRRGDGRGTIRKQAFDTAAEMIAFAKRKGWSGVHVVDGHPLMEWAAWMASQDEGIGLEGYSPSEEDIKKRERVKRSDLEDLAKMEVRLKRR